MTIQYVNLSGLDQESAIEANRSPYFRVQVVAEPYDLGGGEFISGVGRVLNDTPVKGYDVVYPPSAIILHPSTELIEA